MKAKLVNIARYVGSLALIFLCLWAGNAVNIWLPFLPGSLWGMLILFTLLSLNIVPQEWAAPGCELFLRYMALLFVPISVGVMEHFGVLARLWLPLVVGCLVSTVLVLVTVAFIMEHRGRHPERDAADV